MVVNHQVPLPVLKVRLKFKLQSHQERQAHSKVTFVFYHQYLDSLKYNMSFIISVYATRQSKRFLVIFRIKLLAAHIWNFKGLSLFKMQYIKFHLFTFSFNFLII